LNSLRGSGKEVRDVPPGRQLDPEFIPNAAPTVIHVEALTNFTGFDPDRGIRAGFIRCRAAKQLDADGPFLEILGVTGEGLVHNVAKELLAAFAGGELCAPEYAFELLPDCRFFDDGAVFPRPVPSLTHFPRSPVTVASSRRRENCNTGGG
jgi:hypothetical protein